jgi:hypothetical protein
VQKCPFTLWSSTAYMHTSAANKLWTSLISILHTSSSLPLSLPAAYPETLRGPLFILELTKHECLCTFLLMPVCTDNIRYKLGD